MTLSLSELLEEIYNTGTVPLLLESLNCTDIKLKSGRQGDDLLTARLPNSSNSRSIQIYLSPKLHTEIVTRSISGNIYSLVGYILYDCKNFDDVKNNLYQITAYIKNVLNIEDETEGFEETYKPKKDYNSWLRPIQKSRQREFDIPENKPIPNNILNQFINYSWQGWIKEDITIETQKEFQIGFDLKSERVTLPLHNSKGELIGIKGRYVGSDPYLLKQRKYMYIYPISKTVELFNLHRALPFIKKTKKVLIVEGAKTCLQFWSWGIKNVVSLEGDRISPIQVKILKELGIDISFYFAWDKDKDEEFIINQLRQFKSRNVFYIMDSIEEPLLDKKNSIADKGKKIALVLINKHCYVYNKL